jgi:hypothetical protein
MAHHLIPSNTTIKAIKLGDARHRLTDGAGLYLRLFVNGGSQGWRFDYSLNGRRNTLSLGTYPDTGLIPPMCARKLAANWLCDAQPRNVSRTVCRRSTRSRQSLANGMRRILRLGRLLTRAKTIRRLEQDVFPWIGAKPVNAIRPTELLTLLKRVEDLGAIETTHRVQQNCGQDFRYAVATGCAESDASRDLRGALTPWKPEHYPTLTDARDVGRLLRDIEAYESGFITQCAMRLSPMLFVRPGELRRAEWGELNLEEAEWRAPAAKMKGFVCTSFRCPRRPWASCVTCKLSRKGVDGCSRVFEPMENP